jgi:mRNA-degrading endonuclease toxin of MazEF toxin-antitoxin module
MTYKQGELYWCNPDPSDTVGAEHRGPHIWGIISVRTRPKCIVAVPLSRHIDKAYPPLLPPIPASEFTHVDGTTPVDRVALTDQIRSLDVTRLQKKSGSMSRIAIRAILLALDYVLGRPAVPPNAN